MKLDYFKKAVTILILSVAIIGFSGCDSATPDATVTTTESPTQSTTQSSTEATTTSDASSAPYYFDDFELIKLDGTKTSLYAYEGQMIILNFWATWCVYCVEEMPLLDELDKRDDVTVLAVSVGEDEKTVRDYIEKNGYAFDVFLDEEGKLASRFDVRGFPTSIFIGKDFEYFYSYPGMVEEETIDAIFEAIDGILKERENQ